MATLVASTLKAEVARLRRILGAESRTYREANPAERREMLEYAVDVVIDREECSVDDVIAQLEANW